ncbi:hypothetical protein HDU86_007541 [Geranomyces michiganensis]|nr:hypothetical protein HDU86_007541 [Geranomyces michiganensis]
MSRYTQLPFETEAPLYDEQTDNDIHSDNVQLLDGTAVASDDDDDNDNEPAQTSTAGVAEDANSNDDPADLAPPTIARAAESSLGPAATTAPIPTTSPPRYPIFVLRDGVFTNLNSPASSSSASASASHDPTKPYAAEPPSYIENLSAPPPAYEPTVVSSSGLGDDGEVLIEGLPVGDISSFVGHALFSIAFDFIGFCLTAILAQTHAARAGARVGLGVTLCRYGAFMLRDPSDDPYGPWDDNASDDYNNRRADNAKWVSAIFLLVGTFTIIRSLIDLIYVSRLEKVIKSSSATTAEATPV